MPVGSIVEVVITISASVPVTGELGIEILRDITVGPDMLEKTCGFPVSIGTEPVGIGPCTFHANLPTSSSFRQYYFRLFWSGTLIYSPVDPATRPHVITK